MMGETEAEDLDAIADLCSDAADRLMTSLETVLKEVSVVRLSSPEVAARIEAAARAGLEACAFQDMVGQRLTRVRNGRSADPLLAGPQSAATGLSQAAVDAMFD